MDLDDWKKPVARNGTSAFVADIGGTKARFAIADLEGLRLSSVRSYLCSEVTSPDAAFRRYREDVGSLPALAAVAVAGPVVRGSVQMTNLGWNLSLDDIRRSLGFEEALLLNDFEAAALSLPFLPDEATVTLREGRTATGGRLAVVGPGTGLGVACLASTTAGWLPVPGEGGHASLAVQSAKEWRFVEEVAAGRQHVSAEFLLSGGGLTRIYNALADRVKAVPEAAAAPEVAARAASGADPCALEAVRLFTSWLGGFAGDIALVYGAFGGVFVAGGVVPNLLPVMDTDLFLRSFADKGRMQGLLAQVPVRVVTDTNSGLLGAAVAARSLV